MHERNQDFARVDGERLDPKVKSLFARKRTHLKGIANKFYIIHQTQINEKGGFHQNWIDYAM